ncbi:MAG: CHAT domain-containing protein, partial [Limnothrix sp.]
MSPGVPLAEEQVEWAVDNWLAEAAQLMNDPLSRLLQGTGRLSDKNQLITSDANASPLDSTAVEPILATNLLEFGQKLYRELFTGSLKESWSRAQAIAHNQNQILRLRLGYKETRLLSLPWEVINATDSSNFEMQSLTTGIETSFSRYHSTTHGSTDTLSMGDVHEQPLKILMVLASPADQERLELSQEATHLQSELEKETPAGTPALELTILDNPGRQELTEVLEQGQYQVFHYAGHSNLGHFGGDIYLVNRATGLTEPFAGDDLAGLLVNNGVQFAVFNSCHGADGITGLDINESTEKSLAQALVRRGIPAVLAMSAQIPDQVALTFTRLLYRNLHQGYPIDFSLGRVRQGLISAYGSNQLYWALPVLYM